MKQETRENLSQMTELYAHIEAYNSTHKADPIQFLHGGSSAIFALAGREIRNNDNQESEQTVIPSALIPTGILRKKYKIYPFSGEVAFGVFGPDEDDSQRKVKTGHHIGGRKLGVNYYSLSGMSATLEGLKMTYHYAEKFHDKFIDISSLHQQVHLLIMQMQPKNCIRTLKMLEMYLTNLMLLDPTMKDKASNYLKLLNIEYTALRNDPAHFSPELDRRFKKHLLKLEAILKNDNLPLKTDDEFIQAILKQFPIIYCSTVKGKHFAENNAQDEGFIQNECFHQGEIPLDTVKMMLTPVENVQALQSILKDHGLDHIQVQGYRSINQFEITTSSTKIPLPGSDELAAEYEFMKKKSGPNQESYNKLFWNYIDDFLNTGSVDSFKAALFLKQVEKEKGFSFLSDKTQAITNYINLYQQIQRKIAIDPDYLQKISKYLSIGFEKLEAIAQIFSPKDSAKQGLLAQQKIFNNHQLAPYFFKPRTDDQDKQDIKPDFNPAGVKKS